MAAAKAKATVKQRRSKEEIERERADKEKRAQEREAERLRREEAAAAIRAEAVRQDVARRVAHEEDRRRQRLIQDAGIEWSMGYDTPAAKLVAEYVRGHEAAVKQSAERIRRAGDPLNLMAPPSPPLNKRQKKRLEREAEEGRLAKGLKYEPIPDLDNPRQNVMVMSLPHSFRRLKLQIHQEPAAERFVADWEAAHSTGLQSKGFDPKVDSSAKPDVARMRPAEAKARLKMARDHIGKRNFDICVGVLIFNLNATKVHSLGGRDNRSVSSDIEVALNALAGFYDPVRMEKDPTWRAFQKVLELGQNIIDQLEDEVR